MENNNQPKSEATDATQNLVRTYDLFRALADAIENDTLKTWTDFDIDRVCYTIADILRGKGCAVQITSPHDIAEQVSYMQEDEGVSFQLESWEAVRACKWIEDNRYLNEIQGEVFTDACAEALRVKKGGAK